VTAGGPAARRDAAWRKVSSIASIGECMIELRAGGGATSAPAFGGAVAAFGGDSLNTAVYLARLLADRGVAVDYATALGDDPWSSAMIAAWRAEGVGTGLVATLPDRLPGLYMIRTDERGERAFYYWRRQAAARDLLRQPQAGAIVEQLARYGLLYLTGVSVAILDDDRRRLLGLLERARADGALIAFDSNYRARNWAGVADARRWTEAAARVAHLALSGFEDERLLFGDASPEATAERLERLGVSEVAVRSGAEPCVVLSRDGLKRVPAERVAAPLDTTAAGDSFNAAYIAARVLGHGAEQAARHGHALAAAVIRYPGAIIPVEAMPRLP